MEPALTYSLVRSPRAFTLVELLVVLAIIVVITAITMLGQSNFNRSLILTDTAYTVAFSVREAQALGISSRAFSGILNAGYGVRFSSGSPSSYTLFADIAPAAPGDTANPSVCPGHSATTGPEAKPGDCIQGSAAEVVRTYTLNRGFRIAQFCGVQTSGGTLRCSDYLDALNILYLRPNTQSIIVGERSGTRIALSDATIRLSSPDGVTERCIYVSRAGQVSVHAKGDTECP